MSDVWVGLVTCVPKEGNTTLDGAAGAKTWAFVPATGLDHFTTKVRAAFSALGFDVEDIEEIEPFSQRSSRMILKQGFWANASEAKRSRSMIHGTFHTYSQE